VQVQDPNAAMAADMAGGMYPTLEQQVAAAASGIGPLMSGAAMSPPRSTDVRTLIHMRSPRCVDLLSSLPHPSVSLLDRFSTALPVDHPSLPKHL